MNAAVITAVNEHVHSRKTKRLSDHGMEGTASSKKTAFGGPLIDTAGPTIDLNGDGIIDANDQIAVIMEGAPVGYIGPLDATVKIKSEEVEGELVDTTAEELGLEQKCDSAKALPMGSLGKCLEIKDGEYFCEFETEKEGKVKCWVQGAHLEGMPDMGRGHLLEVLTRYTARHDAFVTLPNTVVYIFVFIVLVTGHLRIWERQLLEAALEAWVNGRNPETSCENNVDDINAFWEWMDSDSGLDNIYGIQKEGIVNPSHTQYFVASRTTVLGDVQVTKTKFDGSQQSQWLLRETAGAAHLAANAGDYANAVKEGAKSLSNIDAWKDPDIERMSVVFAGYNEMARFYSVTEVLIKFRKSGATIPKINAEVVPIDPYPSYILLVFDFVFFCFVAKMFVGEGGDVLTAASMGLGELADYFGFWNCVDWASIIFGFLVMGLWIVCFVTMGSETLHKILNDDMKIKVDVMDVNTMPTSFLEELLSAIDSLRLWYMMLHMCMAMNTISIVVKFFKGFTSNQRLNVVAATFKSATTDFIHFAIIFLTIFLPFSIIAHVLFGNDIIEFSSVFASLNTSFLVLMGEFGWYVDCCGNSSESTVMASGMPTFIVFVWFAIYMFLVFLVLLNMLLAIIINHYLIVTEYLNKITKKLDKDLAVLANPTLWQQARQYREFKKDTKGHIPLDDILAQLTNDSNMAHPKFAVTKASLLEAFGPEVQQEGEDEGTASKPLKANDDAMTEENAEWLMELLEKELKLKRAKVIAMQEEDVEDHVENVDHSVEVIDKHVLEGNQETHEIKEMLEHLNNRVHQSMFFNSVDIPEDEEEEDNTDVGQTSGADAAQIQGLSDATTGIQSTLATMEQTMAKIQRDQARLGKRLDELAANAPGAEDNKKGEVKDLASKLRERNNLKKETNAPGGG